MSFQNMNSTKMNVPFKISFDQAKLYEKYSNQILWISSGILIFAFVIQSINNNLKNISDTINIVLKLLVLPIPGHNVSASLNEMFIVWLVHLFEVIHFLTLMKMSISLILIKFDFLIIDFLNINLTLTLTLGSFSFCLEANFV